VSAPLESRDQDGRKVLVFAGTEVRFQELLDCLRRNGSLEEFLEHHPAVTHEQAVAALAHIAKLGSER
jgi:uncharacterized protein (DUF433 family)